MAARVALEQLRHSRKFGANNNAAAAPWPLAPASLSKCTVRRRRRRGLRAFPTRVVAAVVAVAIGGGGGGTSGGGGGGAGAAGGTAGTGGSFCDGWQFFARGAMVLLEAAAAAAAAVTLPVPFVTEGAGGGAYGGAGDCLALHRRWCQHQQRL